MRSTTIEATDRVASETDDRVLSTLKLVAPVGLGLFPLGLGFGVLVIHAGLPWWWAPLSAGLIYAGSLEFLLVPMALAATPLLAVAATALVVNSRHVFYALSFPLHRVRGLLPRAYATFGLTDEAYALTAAPEAQTWTTRRIVVLQLLLQSFWVSGATAGAAGRRPEGVAAQLGAQHRRRHRHLRAHQHRPRLRLRPAGGARGGWLVSSSRSRTRAGGYGRSRRWRGLPSRRRLAWWP
jgi:hypothetical protein